MTVVNPLMQLLDCNKLKDPRTTLSGKWTSALKFEELSYVTINPLPVEINSDSTLAEQEIFEKWNDESLMVKSYILWSMVPDLLRQYIKVPDAWSNMQILHELFEAN